jgi:uncharacterized RDD family membrane protein YckC
VTVPWTGWPLGQCAVRQLRDAASARPEAGVVSRGAAYVVDASVLAGIVIVSIAVAQLIGAVTGLRARDLARLAGPLAVTALPLLFVLYLTVFWGLAGRTPGMALFALRVVATDGRPLSWSAAALRAVTLTVFPVGFLWSVVDRRHQAVHDKLARTLVVRIPPVPRYRTSS